MSLLVYILYVMSMLVYILPGFTMHINKLHKDEIIKTTHNFLNRHF